jgi:D-glycero-D-manno-heptose 1,7-bisphosphate phosphatase
VTARAAVFLDRDGVLNELVPDPASGLPESPLRPEQVRLLPHAAASAARLRAAGYPLVCVTNQPAAAKGAASVQRLIDIHQRVLELLAERGVELDAWRMCLHHPDGVVRELATACDCRKPAPGMLLDAGRELGVEMSRSWMVGDTDADVEAGRAAGCRTLLIASPQSAHKRCRAVSPDLVAADFREAAGLVLGDHGR